MHNASLTHLLVHGWAAPCPPPAAPFYDADYAQSRRECEEAMAEFANLRDAQVAVPRELLELLAELGGVS